MRYFFDKYSKNRRWRKALCHNS